MSTAPHFTFGTHDLNEKVMIVAEIGNNHEGDAGLAREMVIAAAEAGADAVKFQTIEPAKLVAADQTARIAQLGRFHLSNEIFEGLAETATAHGAMFLSTPFHLDAAEWLGGIAPGFKIASGDLTYTRLLETVAAAGKPILLSTGASTMDEIRAAKANIENVWAAAGTSPGLVLLHCTVSYPTAPQDANLSALPDLASLGTAVGFSDHTIGNEAAVLSVALGARVIEKHFTLDKNQSDFRDHQLSADPADMKALVEAVRRTETLIGSGGKRVLDCEAEVAPAVRRSVHAARDIAAGAVLGTDDTICLRPQGGVAPSGEAALAGRRAKAAIAAGTIITDGMLD